MLDKNCKPHTTGKKRGEWILQRKKAMGGKWRRPPWRGLYKGAVSTLCSCFGDMQGLKDWMYELKLWIIDVSTPLIHT